MSREKQRKFAGYALLAGMIFLVIGITTDKVIFTWGAVVLALIALILGGRRRFQKPNDFLKKG